MTNEEIDRMVAWLQTRLEKCQGSLDYLRAAAAELQYRMDFLREALTRWRESLDDTFMLRQEPK